MTTNLPIAIFCCYLLTMLIIGLWGYKAQECNSLRSYYLANGKLVFLPLFFTIYATKFSGNTFLGFSAKSYRSGFIIFLLLVMWTIVSSMVWIYAARLKKLSDEKEYLTIGDYIQDRFSYKPLTYLVNIIFIIVLANYILTNMKAAGYLMSFAFGEYFSFAGGILSLVAVLVIYQCLGGMKSVAVTDIIQGSLMIIGSIITFYLLCSKVDFSQALQEIKQNPVVTSWWEPLSSKQILKWGSFLVVASSLAFYPHLMQRIFAAKSADNLRRIYAISIVVALVTTFVALLLGIMGRKFFPDLAHLESENIALRMISMLSEGTAIGTFFMALFFTVIISAVMSTVDSASLTTSSIIVKDIAMDIKPKMSLKSANILGRASIIILMLAMALVAIYLKKDIFFIIKIKLEILILIVPTILLGLAKKPIAGQSIYYALLVSFIFVLGMFTLSAFEVIKSTAIYHLNAGFIGLLINLATIYILEQRRKSY